MLIYLHCSKLTKQRRSFALLFMPGNDLEPSLPVVVSYLSELEAFVEEQKPENIAKAIAAKQLKDAEINRLAAPDRDRKKDELTRLIGLFGAVRGVTNAIGAASTASVVTARASRMQVEKRLDSSR